ncbi:hypothetical protein V1264_024237 [Littorina saxatilis]|uniref:Uncharacterized protein n=1 Tax=Littorina saxatilis TaxID=31220 RepID=A0AAN9FZ88_9CAEN
MCARLIDPPNAQRDRADRSNAPNRNTKDSSQETPSQSPPTSWLPTTTSRKYDRTPFSLLHHGVSWRTARNRYRE